MLKEEKEIKRLAKMPILDESQLNEIENKIMWAYYTQNKICLEYYKYGHFYKINCYIKKIDPINKVIITSSQSLFFKQILKISYPSVDATGSVETQ
jgi:uncharacterized protein (DUF1015 family)